MAPPEESGVIYRGLLLAPENTRPGAYLYGGQRDAGHAAQSTSTTPPYSPSNGQSAQHSQDLSIEIRHYRLNLLLKAHRYGNGRQIFSCDNQVLFDVSLHCTFAL